MRQFLAFVFVLTCCLSHADEKPPACPSSCTNPDHNHDWSDDSRTYISNRADGLVRWIDGFFGENTQNTESKTSFMRLRTSVFLREDEATHLRVNLRGKVRLENLNKHLSILFSDDKEGETNQQNLNQTSQQLNANTDVALQFNEINTDNHRLDYRIGLRSSLHPKAEVRYRYENPYGKNELFRSVQSLRYRGEDRFDVISEYEQAHAMSESRLLRSSLQLRYGQVSNGVEWRTTIQLSKKLNDHKAINYFASMHGHTQPTYLTETYGIGLNYRQRFIKDWLFIEAEPAYFWEKDSPQVDRIGAPQFITRLEILFD